MDVNRARNALLAATALSMVPERPRDPAGTRGIVGASGRANPAKKAKRKAQRKARRKAR